MVPSEQPIVFAMAALGLNQAAFDSETIRSAIQSVDRGQIDAARSLGMTGFQVLKRVILPQAGAVALLPLGNSVISLIKWLETKVTVPDEAPEMDEDGNLHIRRGKKEKAVLNVLQ